MGPPNIAGATIKVARSANDSILSPLFSLIYSTKLHSDAVAKWLGAHPRRPLEPQVVIVAANLTMSRQHKQPSSDLNRS